MALQLRPVLFAALGATLLSAIAVSAQTGKNHAQHNGLPQDWSQHHLIFTEYANRQVSQAEINEPRARVARLARARARENSLNEWRDRWSKKIPPVKKTKEHIDWSVNLGATMAPGTYPAKWSFNINATPDCVNDYVVFGLNTGGLVSQANLVGLNNLYSGSAGGTGICGSGAATVYWAYQVPGAIQTSTTVSWDGTKIAFLEAGSPAKFHVLAWKASDGTVGAPKAPALAAGAPASGSGEMASVALSSPFTAFCPDSPTSASSPYIDYDNDMAYVGADNGCVYRIKNVFCTTAACIGTPVAPSLDLSWGSGAGAYLLTATAGTTVLGSPIFDSGTGNVFVGSTNGKVFGVNTTTQQLMNGSGQQFGTGSFPSTVNLTVDSFNQWVYLYSANASGLGLVGTPELIQFRTTNMLEAVNSNIGAGRVLLDKGPQFGITFNDAYFTNPDSTTWFVYFCSVTGLGGPDAPALYRVGFGPARSVNSSNDGVIVSLNSGTADHCGGPLTEFKNGATDRLFFNLTNPGVVGYADITGAPTLSGTPTPVSAPGGTTGIIVDGVSTAGQASSIYFMELGSTNAVKLTQSGLQ